MCEFCFIDFGFINTRLFSVVGNPKKGQYTYIYNRKVPGGLEQYYTNTIWSPIQYRRLMKFYSSLYIHLNKRINFDISSSMGFHNNLYKRDFPSEINYYFFFSNHGPTMMIIRDF